MFAQIFTSLKFGVAVAALEISLLRVNHHVVLELVLVSQDFAANLARENLSFLGVHHFAMIIQGLFGAIRLSTATFEVFGSSVSNFMPFFFRS